MRSCYCIFIFVLLVGGARAQQVGMYNHYFFNPVVYNPAFAGSGEDVRATLISRAQWAGFRNAPQLNMFVLDGPLKEKKIGLGLLLLSDRRGINRRTGGNVSYSYSLNFSEEARLMLGISAGVINHSIDFSEAVAEDYSDPTLFFSAQQRTVIDGNAGLAFIWKGLEFGVAAPQLFENKINYPDNTGTRTSYAQKRHYMGSLKYKFNLSEEKGISLAPQALVRIVPNTPFQFDGNLNLEWKDKFWVGATYKSSYAVSANAGLYLHRKFCVGYSYEFITSNIGTYSGLSHELMMSFKFGGGKEEKQPKEEVLPDEKSVNAGLRVDSLQEVLSESQEKIKELNKKLNEQSKKQQQTQEQVEALEKKIKENASQVNVPNNTIPDTNNEGASSTNATEASKSQKNNSSAKTQNANSASGKQVNSTYSNTEKTSSSNKSQSANSKSVKTEAPDQFNTAPPPPLSKVQVNGVWITTYAAANYVNESNSHPGIGFYIIVGTFFYKDFALAEMERFKAQGYKESNWLAANSRHMNYIYTYMVNNENKAIAKVKEMQAAGVKDAWIIKLN